MVYDPDEARRIGSYKGGQAAAISLARIAREFYEPLIPIAVELHDKGLSLRDIAEEFVKREIKSPQGNAEWSAAQVRRILIRAGKSTQAATPKSKEGQQPTATGNAAREMMTNEDVSAEMKASKLTPTALPTPAPADIVLWLNGEARGYFSKEEIKALWAKEEVQIDTPYMRDGVHGWRPLRELFQ